MTAAVSIDFDDADFTDSLKRFLKYNKRDAGMLVERTARKVVLGIGGGKVQGLKQLARAHKATRSKIRAEMKPLRAGFVMVNDRGKKSWTSFGLKGPANRAPFKGKKVKELKRRQKMSGWVARALTMKWPFPKSGRNGTIKPALKVRHLVRIRCAGVNPEVVFISRDRGLVKLDARHKIGARALRNGADDMDAYVARKQVEAWRKS